jgi:hypothetical protein
MSVDRKEGRRTNHRAFRPTLDGGLESRLLLSKLPGHVFLNHPQPGVAYVHKQPPLRSGTHAHKFPVAVFPRGPSVKVEVAHGGQSVVVGTPDGSHFQISLTHFVPTPPSSTTGAAVTPTQPPIQEQIPGAGPIQPIGTVRAYQMSGGRVGLIVDGTTTQSELDISPFPFKQRKGYAHSFAYAQTKQSHILNIGQIIVNSGVISAINGYHTADLSGPLNILGNQIVDRISFDALLPGASIQTGSDLNTLDVLNGVNLNSGPGIVIGRDLNLFNAGQNVNLSNGASIKVARFLGTTPQPPKGTANGSNFLALNQALVGTGTSTIVPSLSGFIQGDLNIGAGSVFSVGSGIANSSILGTTTAAPSVFLVNGFVNAPLASEIAIPNLRFSNIISTTVGTPPQPFFFNFVARNGSNSPFFFSLT